MTLILFVPLSAPFWLGRWNLAEITEQLGTSKMKSTKCGLWQCPPHGMYYMGLWGVRLWNGFVKCFLIVSQAAGLYCSSRAAQGSKDIFRIHITKPFSKPDNPDCSLHLWPWTLALKSGTSSTRRLRASTRTARSSWWTAPTPWARPPSPREAIQ